MLNSGCAVGRYEESALVDIQRFVSRASQFGSRSALGPERGTPKGRLRRASFAAVIALLASFAPAAAQAETLIQVSAIRVPADLDFDLRFTGGFNFGHSLIVDFVDDYTLTTDDLTVPSLGVEHRWANGTSLGLSVGRDQTDLTLDFHSEVTGRFDPTIGFSESEALRYAEVELTPVLVDLGKVWSLPRQVSLGVGATVGYVLADAEVVQSRDNLPGFFSAPGRDHESGEPLPVRVEDELVYGLFTRLEFELADGRVRPFLRARALESDLQLHALQESREIELGPLWLELGVAFALPN